MNKERLCPKCGKLKSFTEYYTLREESGDRLTYWCKECIDHYIKNTSIGAN